jgi:C-terminal processing protease CtpA/Prc
MYDARSVTYCLHTTPAEDNPQAKIKLFNDALQKIRIEYVDGTDLTYQQLVYSALEGAVRRAGSRTADFFDPDSFQQLQDDAAGQFGGLGLLVALKGGLCDGCFANGRHARLSRLASSRATALSRWMARVWCIRI